MNELVQSALTFAAHGGPVALVALAVATFVSEDLACIAAGLLVVEGAVGFTAAVIACFTGILAGDLMLVLLGRTIGRRSLEAAPLRWWVSADAVRRAENWFERRGPGLILASRFMPGTRLPTYVAAGVLRAPLLRFVGWFVFACALWTPLLVGLAVAFGRTAREFFAGWSSVAPAIVVAALLVWATSRLIVSLSTWRGRRKLLGRWRRLTRWEFWPMWAVYPPVVAYIAWLGLRHRRLTLPTIVNPGIGAGGGLVGESKSDILRGLAGSDLVARWGVIPAGAHADRLAAVREWIAREQLNFPVVIKPDVGERGAGVVIARDFAAVERALAENPAALIAQAYVPGVEYGVFYFRRPTAARGEILAITDKRMVTITGDGRHTLEELILGDERAVCMAAFFLERFSDRLDEVPRAGERIALSELGTHCRGALFLDGTHLLTPALHLAIERASRAFDGFYFGRYDVRAGSPEAFQRGEFKVIELNGLTSEATSIYDPRHSVWFGWRTLCRQWRIAFEIAAANRSRGAEPLTLNATWQLILKSESPS
jgi:membrane protein DedA with SNARE-associated domain